MEHGPNRRRLAILVGGGPAPGINGVIHSATIEAINNGVDVVGIFDGFEHLMQGKLVSRPLSIADVSRIHLRGRSILRTSRANPTKADRRPGPLCGCPDPGGDRLPVGDRRR